MNKKTVNINTTIDIKHNEMLERFNDIETNVIPKLKEENAQLMEDIKKFKTKKDVDIFMEMKKLLIIKNTLKNSKKKKITISLRIVFIYSNILKKKRKYLQVIIIKI